MYRVLPLAVLFLAAAAAEVQDPPEVNRSMAAPADVAAPPADADKTRSGLATRVLSKGNGTEHPGPADQVTVHYTGWTTSGRMFDSSLARGGPATLSLDRVLPGLREAILLMVEGERRRAWVPEKLADKGGKGIPKGMLVFDIELIGITPSPTKAPPDVGGPPPGSKRTFSGVAYRVLREGTGTRHPFPTSTVTVHYSGWTTDGKLFDSSIPEGKPRTFSLDRVIQGWRDGMRLMVEGQKMRFWIPEDLAYKGLQQPYGMLVFDIELIRIH